MPTAYAWLKLMKIRGGGAVQHRGSILASHPAAIGLKSWLCHDFFSLLLSWWTVLRLNPSSAKQWISQIQSAVTSRAKHYWKKLMDNMTENGSNNGNSAEVQKLSNVMVRKLNQLSFEGRAFQTYGLTWEWPRKFARKALFTKKHQNLEIPSDRMKKWKQNVRLLSTFVWHRSNEYLWVCKFK